MRQGKLPFKVKVSIGEDPVQPEGAVGTGDKEGGVPSLTIDPRAIRDGRHHTTLRHD